MSGDGAGHALRTLAFHSKGKVFNFLIVLNLMSLVLISHLRRDLKGNTR